MTLSWSPSARRTVGVVIAFAVVLGAIEAFSFHVWKSRGPNPLSWPEALTHTVPSWLVIAALAWPVRILARRFPFRERTWKSVLPLHIVASFLFVVACSAATAVVFQQLGFLGGEPLHAATTRLFYTYLAYLLSIYWAILWAFHALDYYRESEQRERERAVLAASLTQARLHALRSQLNPHFFFNTLNAISTFALQGKPDRVGAMVASLGDLVRVCVDDSLPHEVRLVRELELLELYLDIQRVRFADWLEVEIEVEPEAEDVLVPSLILQPLVENAIEHGLSHADGSGRVGIRCTLEDDHLAIEVRNNGPTVKPETPAAHRVGVGLANTRARLEQLHPGRHEFRFGVVEGGWYSVRLRIPARHAGPDPAAIEATR